VYNVELYRLKFYILPVVLKCLWSHYFFLTWTDTAWLVAATIFIPTLQVESEFNTMLHYASSVLLLKVVFRILPSYWSLLAKLPAEASPGVQGRGQSREVHRVEEREGGDDQVCRVSLIHLKNERRKFFALRFVEWHLHLSVQALFCNKDTR